MTTLSACLVIVSVCGGLLNVHAGAQTTEPPKGERPTTVIPREGCVTAECHPGLKQTRFVHGPINANACDSCHTLKDAATHTFQDTRPREQMCTLCHTVEIPAAQSIHLPFAEKACLSCHDPHGSKESALLRGDRYADACMTCHTDITGAHDQVHGPASAGACGACHQPHAAKAPKLLNAEGRDLCLKCHISVAKAIEKSPVVHEPMHGDCLVCHNAHATDNPSMLNKEPAALCTSCHNDIAHTMETATTQHAAVTTSRACLNCHSAHASSRQRLLKRDEMELCFECHNTTISLKDGSTLLNMKQVIASGRSLHGAIAQESCSACHEIHGGGHRRLLKNEYPTEMYYPFSETAYALCFSCHDKNLVTQEKNETVTGFRNGSQNLHFVHVHRGDKGRSCRVCHDSHAATRDKHIREETPYGPAGWRLPIKYESLENGGRCGPGCHTGLEYNRVNPLIYPSLRTGEWKGDGLAAPKGTPEQPKPDSTQPATP